MKMFLAFLLLSTAVFAGEPDATEALLSVLPANSYNGQTPDGENCGVSVSGSFSRVRVTAWTNDMTKTSDVASGAVFRWNYGNRSFLASTVVNTMNGTKENLVRTIAVENNTQYVVVADVFTNNGDTRESKIECIINI